MIEENIRIGRIAGIRVGINWSLLVIFWLITWSLASEVLPDDSPGHSTAAYWVAAALTALVFYSCLLAHELGHSLVARRAGVGVEGITLWLFGGVAQLEGEPHSARDELRIAAVGPAISFGVGAAFALVAVIADGLGASDLVVAVPVWLATINVVLAVFNLVPAFPLDGGRVLRAILWARHGDALRATRTAAAAGRGFAYLLIGLGLVEFAAGAGVGGLWFVFLGWFLLGAARAEGEQAEVHHALAGLRIGDVMTRDPITVPDHLPIDRFVDEVLLTHRCSSFPVLDAGGRLTGLVTLDRVRMVPPANRAGHTVGEVAIPLERVAVASPDRLLEDELASMGRRGGRLLVLDQGRLVGILSSRDVARIVTVKGVAAEAGSPGSPPAASRA